MITREEHLEWAKARAIFYVDIGDLAGAVSSMVSDMAKHPQIDLPHGVSATPLVDALAAVTRGDADAVRRWVEGWALADG